MTTRYQLRQELGAPVPPRDERDWVFSTELQAEAAITYRRLDYWTRTGLLQPLHEDITPGTGHVRRYPVDQVERARAIATLLDAGVSLPVCRQVIDDLVATGHATSGQLTFVLTPTGDTAA